MWIERLESRQFFSTTPYPPPPGSVDLTGTVVGTAGSYKSQGNAVADAFDGNPATFFDAPSADGDWAGLDLAVARTITQVQFVPRPGWAGRMVGGLFQGSPTADFSAGVVTLARVAAAPPAGRYTAVAVPVATAFEFVRYLAPAGGYGNVAELEFDGFPGVVSTPVLPVSPAVPAAPGTPAATATAAGVRLTWPADPTGVVTNYAVERQSPTDSAYGTVATVTGTAYVDAAVAPSTPYSYRVVANDAAGASPPSAAVSVTTPAPVVNPWADANVGSPGQAGTTTANAAGTVTVTGGGADIWGQTDAFNFDNQTLVGDGSVVARITSQADTNGWAKAGVMVRESAGVDSRYVLLAVTPSHGLVLQARTATHSAAVDVAATTWSAGVWLRLARVGSTFTAATSADGVAWKTVGTVTVPMVNDPLVGLAVCAHDNSKLGAATFTNVAVTAGAAASVWSDAAAAPMARWESQTFTYAGKLYVFGGFVDRNLDTTAECDVYDPAADTWTDLTTLPVGGMAHAAVAVVGDTVYFAGGTLGRFTYNAASPGVTAVLTYDLTTGVWGTSTPLPVGVSCGGLAYINDHLYYYGGLNPANTADVANTWGLDLGNPSAGWVAEAPMPDARNDLGSAVIDGVAYAVGGSHVYNEVSGNDAEVDAYNPATNVWTHVAALPMPWASNETTTLVADGKIVVVGGQTNGGYDGIYLADVEAYDPTTNAWSQVGTLPEANEGESAAYVSGRLIVADGTVDDLGGWSQNQVWVTSDIPI